jgi:hypothetical protein
MPPITEWLTADYLAQPPPRRVPPGVMLDIAGEYLVERPLRTFLDPWLITGVVALGGLLALGMRGLWLALPLALVLARLGLALYRLGRRIGDDIALLRHGLRLRAHILKLRPYRTTLGEIDGALLDCAIPVAPRRTYIGSVWLHDGTEALRLARAGAVEVLCLPHMPGTWRLVEPVRGEVCYDRLGPAEITHER